MRDVLSSTVGRRGCGFCALVGVATLLIAPSIATDLGMTDDWAVLVGGVAAVVATLMAVVLVTVITPPR